MKALFLAVMCAMLPACARQDAKFTASGASSFSAAGLPVSAGVSSSLGAAVSTAAAVPTAAEDDLVFVSRRLQAALQTARIDAGMAAVILADERRFLAMLERALAGDPYLHLLVDKTHPFMPKNYEPADLVELRNGAYRVNRANLTLRREAEAALAAMAEAAQSEGVTLVASSAYRSYEYQAEVYARNVRENGVETADRESARPGYSQHQTGLVVDFGSISDAFAETAAGKWMLKNAARFGWSLSFPDGCEALTGYRWESWHYRYVGLPLAVFINTFFGGIQQYALQFMYAWEEGGPEDS